MESVAINYHKDEGKMLLIKHKGINTPIPFGEESVGNRTLLNLLLALLYVSQNNAMIMIDSFFGSLHNELERLLVKYLMYISKRSHMIFISHSTNLLSISILRPDKIYSVDFDGQNGSHIKRFTGS